MRGWGYELGKKKGDFRKKKKNRMVTFLWKISIKKC